MNIPVQGSCADVLLIALAEADRRLRDLDAAIIATVHDEIVAEVGAGDAAEAARRLEAAMVHAFLEVFPEAPVTGLVDVAIVGCWAEAKGVSGRSSYLAFPGRTARRGPVRAPGEAGTAEQYR